jgi:hypothetical protein
MVREPIQMPTFPPPERLADGQTACGETCAERKNQPLPTPQLGRAAAPMALSLNVSITQAGLWLLLLFVAEAVIFYTQTADQIAPFFPMNFDQAGYANYTYQLYEAIRDRGWIAIASEITEPPTATGTALIIQGAILSLVGGANRITLTSINLLYFLALQTVVVLTILARTRSVPLAIVALALLLSLRTIFNPAGGIFDYRMDFVALCLYGIWACLILWSDRFAERRIMVGATCVAILLVATRTFTLIYTGCVVAGLLSLALLDRRHASDMAERELARRRVRNTFWSAAALGLATLPLLLLARSKIYEKYVVGHVLNNEKYIRAEEMNVHSAWEHALFYPKSVLLDHTGPTACWLVLALFVTGLIALVFSGRGAARGMCERAYRGDVGALAMLIVVPIIFLTIDIAKSTVVGGIIAVPLVLTAILAIDTVNPYLSKSAENSIGRDLGKRKLFSSLPAALTIGVAIVALGTFLVQANSKQHDLPRNDLETINSLNDTIASYLVRAGLREPSMSIDRIIDHLNIGTVAVTAYERDRRILKFRRGMLGDDIFAVPRGMALKLAAESDVLVLTDPVRGRASPYPFNAELKSYWKDLQDIANDRMKLLTRQEVGDITYNVFAKPLVNVGGLSAGWITSAGVTLVAELADLKRWPFLVLQGDAPYEVLGGEPHPHAVLTNGHSPGAELPATLKRTGSQYQVTVDARNITAGESSAAIFVTFDRWFVPRERGINPDTRELVIMAPSRIELQASAP